LTLTRYCQYCIAAINNKRGASVGVGKKYDINIDIAQYNVGNKWGLEGGYCTMMCNNAPFSVSRMIFSRHLDPSETRPLIKAKKKNLQARLPRRRCCLHHLRRLGRLFQEDPRRPLLQEGVQGRSQERRVRLGRHQ